MSGARKTSFSMPFSHFLSSSSIQLQHSKALLRLNRRREERENNRGILWIVEESLLLVACPLILNKQPHFIFSLIHVVLCYTGGRSCLGRKGRRKRKYGVFVESYRMRIFVCLENGFFPYLCLLQGGQSFFLSSPFPFPFLFLLSLLLLRLLRLLCFLFPLSPSFLLPLEVTIRPPEG